ncbi:MAG TPA: LysR family transcriptional regulator [Gammaproteobacteria bacterium]|nr:LysR family transcriptional regulator [Gammaproteobacteria bacterium]
MDRLNCMRAFIAVVEAGGFSRAAGKTRLSKSLLSKYVAQLECDLNARLLNRSTRKVSTTPTGQAYYERSVPILAELDELESSVQANQRMPRGELRISAPVSFAEQYLISLISAFSKSWPDLKIELIFSDRMVDLAEEGVDVALRIADLPDSSLVARRLCPVRTIVCASPAYLRQAGRPKHPLELTQHQAIFDSNIPGKQQWLFREQGKKQVITMQGSITVNSVRAVRQLLLADLGVAMCPDFVVADDIQAGRLDELLTDYAFHDMALYAVYLHRRHLSVKVRLLIDALVEKFSSA